MRHFLPVSAFAAPAPVAALTLGMTVSAASPGAAWDRPVRPRSSQFLDVASSTSGRVVVAIGREVEGGAREIPEPDQQAIPSIFREASRNVFGDSGTLVVWSDLDRVEWKQASTTFEHAELLIGRIYRRFLAKRSERLHPDDPRDAEIGPRRTITLM